jgi:ATP-binding cassette subfamily B protein
MTSTTSPKRYSNLSQLLTSLLTVVGVTIMMFVISPVLGVIALVTIPIRSW